MEFRSKIKIKDRSRITSSLIVSLIAGFICYQFGDDIQQKIERSVKAFSSNSNLEVYGPEYCEAFNSLVNKSDKKIKKVKSGFYIRKKSKNEVKSSDIISSENMISEIKKIQAMTRKAIPDKNVDFSDELNKLIDRNAVKRLNERISTDAECKESREEIADENSKTEKAVVSIQITELKGFSKIDINKNGYGFEFNNTKSGSSCNENGNLNETKENCNYKLKCGINFNCEQNSGDIDKNSCESYNRADKINKISKVKKVRVQSGKYKAIIIERNSEPDDTEIFIDDEELEEENN